MIRFHWTLARCETAAAAEAAGRRHAQHCVLSPSSSSPSVPHLTASHWLWRMYVTNKICFTLFWMEERRF